MAQRDPTVGSIVKEIRGFISLVIDTNDLVLITKLKDDVELLIQEERPELLEANDPLDDITRILTAKSLKVPSSVTPKAKVSNRKFLAQLKEMYHVE